MIKITNVDNFPHPSFDKLIDSFDSESNILQKMDDYKYVASWAIWGEDDIRFDEESMQEHLRGGCALIGLNASKPSDDKWQSFHKTSNDKKLKNALQKSKVWGCYITDLIKHKNNSNSKAVIESLNEEDERDCIDVLIEELNLLGKIDLLIAIGDEVYRRLCNDSRVNGNCKVIRIPHYSAPKYNKSDDYKTDVRRILKGYGLYYGEC